MPCLLSIQHVNTTSLLTSHPQIQWLAAGTRHLRSLHYSLASITIRLYNNGHLWYAGTVESSTCKRTFFCDQTRHPVRPPCHPLQTSSRLKTGLPSAATVEKSPAYSSLGWGSPYFQIKALQLSCIIIRFPATCRLRW